ncbi:MAG: hypothetical protein JRE14_14795 [Deltaproteobacteria bacterium]|nr:hypothetical protein [Deltaproteobacteria bacterium]
MAVSVIAANLQAVAGLNTGILPPIESPDYAYVPVRNQFDATRIIKQLAFFRDGAPFKLDIIAHDICSPTAKISLHEAGHLLGLGHCWESFCIMHFSSNLEALDSLPISFCTACEYEIKRHLRTVVADEK